MKAARIVLTALVAVSVAVPAHAQLGALGKIKKGADKAADTKQKLDDLNINDKEERQLGEQVSLKLRSRFGVYQNADVAKYVSLVGGLVAAAGTRPNLDWKFIVLDSDGVNAYAAPGGIVHITRGLLGLMKNEAQLAGVLGHEITHVNVKHTVRAIERSKAISMGAEQAGSGSVRNELIARLADKAFQTLFNGEFSREDENEADQVGVRLASKLGYGPQGIVDVLKLIDARNNGREDRNGLFASHPATKDRIQKLEKQIAAEKLTGSATADARYKQHISFDAKPVTEIAVDTSGAAGLASGDKKKDDDEKKADDKKEEPKKRGFGLSSITGGSKEAKSSQQVASAGARGVGPDRDAKGGSNPAPINVKITAADLDAFKKGLSG
ncbi:MAG TPA: M48 family metalloprotease [Vicinamibacterales bacterium]|nr:M48 family metalloprotease [Vicinamibacterales bacterium]